MKIRKLIERRIRHAASGITVESDVNAVVAANVGERSTEGPMQLAGEGDLPLADVEYRSSRTAPRRPSASSSPPTAAGSSAPASAPT